MALEMATFTIASGDSLSDAIDIDGKRIVGSFTPPVNGDRIRILGSVDGIDYGVSYSSTGPFASFAASTVAIYNTVDEPSRWDAFKWG